MRLIFSLFGQEEGAVGGVGAVGGEELVAFGLDVGVALEQPPVVVVGVLAPPALGTIGEMGGHGFDGFNG